MAATGCASWCNSFLVLQECIGNWSKAVLNCHGSEMDWELLPPYLPAFELKAIFTPILPPRTLAIYS